MIASLIRWSIDNRVLVLIVALFLTALGTWSARHTPVDALPDLSDVQVIIKTSYPGQAPQVVEDQVTYPLTTAMLSVPQAVTVRGYSFFGDSYVYVIFEDGNGPLLGALARARIFEPGVKPVAGNGPFGSRAGRNRGRLDFPVRPYRSHRWSRSE